jgi:serine/threonine protein kinase/tetratricopeptide (TPR) repeat protein
MAAEEEIFQTAAALRDADRDGFLGIACAGQPDLRGRIEALLRSHNIVGFMQDRTEILCGELPRERGVPSPVEREGDRIGRYKLLQQIGEGGFGVVWMAEQIEPVTRRVALKIIKAGMDTQEVIARFEAERQALAMMDHVNIAKVFDAGATDKGRLFFVMELVRGIPITQFCDQKQFTARQRLELFAEVCSAINHAHQKGVIHRDIKPSNIMVALHADKPVPKVIDFGISKATEGRLTDKTVITRFEQFIGTPAYMSPEQTALSGLDVDTRSDIYALGILLYELLTGKPPFDAKSLLADGYEEMRRIIREVEPPRPSARLYSVAGAERTALAHARRIAPEKLSRSVEPDLDWIVMKAIEKDRARRYETADALRRDIHRFLCDEPVSATPPTTGYRLCKFVRRNRVSLRAAAAVAAALSTAAVLSTWHTAGIAAFLIAATTVSTWQAVRATQAEKFATKKTSDEKAAREEAEAVAAFLSDVLQSPDTARNGRALLAADLLDRAGEKLDNRLKCQPGRLAVLQGVLGRSYHSLGLSREAIPLLEKSMNYMQRTFGPGHQHSLNTVRDLALTYRSAGRWTEALQMQEDVLKLNRKLNGLEHADTLESLKNLAESYSRSDQPLKALEMRKTVLTVLNRVNGAEHPMTISASRRVAESCMGVGELAGEGLELAESALALSRRVLGAEHPDTLSAMHILAHCLEDSGAWKESLKLRGEEVALRQKVLGRDHSTTIHGLRDLARAYYNNGLIDEGLTMQSEALSRSRKLLGSEHPHTIETALETAVLEVSAGRRERALHLLAEVASRPAESTAHLLDIAAIQAWLGLESEYATTCRRLYERAAVSNEPASAYRAVTACCIYPLVDSRLTASVFALARRAGDEGRHEANLPRHKLCLGMAEFRQGNHAAASEALSAAGNGAVKMKISHERACIEGTARCYRVMVLLRQGKDRAARELFGTATEQMKNTPTAGLPCKEVITRDELILWMAIKEAQTLLKPKSNREMKRSRHGCRK